MKSRVVSMWDYTAFPLSEDYTKWRVKDEEIAKRLEAISKSHAQEKDVDVAAMGDSIACSGTTSVAEENPRRFLFYPGRDLIDAAIENACVGLRVGDTTTVQMPEGPVTLTVERIVRRIPMPVSDELIRLEGLEGVDSVAAYTAWYRQQNEAERKEKLPRAAAGLLLSKLVELSTFSIDDEEARAFCQDMVDTQFRVMGGMENTSLVLLDEDVLNPTEAGVKKKLLEMRLQEFPAHVMNAHIVKDLMGLDLEQVYADGWKLLAKMNEPERTEEEVKEYAGISLPKQFALQDAATRFLIDYVTPMMEE